MKKHIVYRTENLVNNRFYYGVHTLTGSRRCERYLGSGILLQQAISKYGRENFIRRTVCSFHTIEEAKNFESLIVDRSLKEDRKCYNVCDGGGVPPGPSNPHWAIGKSFSIETKRKMRKTRGTKIKIDGIPYESFREVEEKLGLNRSKVSRSFNFYGQVLKIEDVSTFDERSKKFRFIKDEVSKGLSKSTAIKMWNAYVRCCDETTEDA